MHDFLTPSILCKNGPDHTHHSVVESKVCWGVLPSSALNRIFGSGPSVLQPPASPPEPMATRRQLDYIESLGGNRQAAKHLTRKNASQLIDELKAKPKEARVTETLQAAPENPKHRMIKGLLDMVPDGYYAVEEYDGGPVTFLRISRPKKDRWKGTIKIQTVHGSPMSVKLSPEPVAALWLTSNTLQVYSRSGQIEDALLLLVADSRAAARRYAKKLEHCCRCNASLTDDRSRHYGIGPECEKVWPHVIEEVDAEEALRAG